jgi:hypothetical protein
LFLVLFPVLFPVLFMVVFLGLPPHRHDRKPILPGDTGATALSPPTINLVATRPASKSRFDCGNYQKFGKLSHSV